MIATLFAQASFDSVPASFLKWFLLCLVAVVLIVCAVYAAFSRGGKQSVKVDREDQPIETRKAAKRYNHDLAEERYQEVTRKLAKHDEEIKEIQKERASALVSINRRFERVLLGLTVIATRLNTKIPDRDEGDE